jgi:hypothetical protein
LVLPDGFRPLLRAAAALPASFDMPLLGAPVELPVVVPVAEDPAVVPVAPPAAEPPPVEVPPDCASAKLAVNVSAVAKPNVASFMIGPFVVALGQRGRPALCSRLPITVRCCSVEGFCGSQRGEPNDPSMALCDSAKYRQSILCVTKQLKIA